MNGVLWRGTVPYCLIGSIVNPRHFGTDPDQRIHTTEFRSGSAFSSAVFKFFCFLLFEGTVKARK